MSWIFLQQKKVASTVPATPSIKENSTMNKSDLNRQTSFVCRFYNVINGQILLIICKLCEKFEMFVSDLNSNEKFVTTAPYAPFADHIRARSPLNVITAPQKREIFTVIIIFSRTVIARTLCVVEQAGIKSCCKNHLRKPPYVLLFIICIVLSNVFDLSFCPE